MRKPATTRSIGLLEAVDDPNLLGAAAKPWPGQRRILEQIDSGEYREIVLALGRRSGKNYMASLVAVHDAAFRDLTAFQRPGEKRYVVCVAGSREQSRITLDYCRQLIAGSPLLEDALESDTGDALEIRQPGTGALVVIRTVAATSRTGRGLAISTLICDEMAHWMSESEGFAVAPRVYGSLTPAVAQFQGEGRIVCISTPFGDDPEINPFARLYQQADSGEHPDMLAVTAPTWEMNPTLSERFYEREKAKDPELFDGEFGAEFLKSGGGFFDFGLFDLAPPGEIPPAAGINWTAALDPAFTRDLFAVAIVGRDPANPRHLLVGAVRSWKPKRQAGESFEALGSAQQSLMAEVVELLDFYGCRSAATDQHMSRAVADYLLREGIACRTIPMTAASKSAVFAELKAKLYGGELALPDDPAVTAELRRVRVRYSAGSSTVILPRVGSSHCDRVQALALGVYAMRGGGGANSRRIRGGGRGKSPSGEGGTVGGGPIDLSEAEIDRLHGLDPATSSRGGRWSAGNR
jgi:phage terminase large subunit-like protein